MPRQSLDELPSTDIEESYVGHGRLRRNEVTVNLIAFRLSRSRYSISEEWRFEARAGAATYEDWNGILRSGLGSMSFEGETDWGEIIRIPHLRLRRRSADQFEAYTREVWLGAATTPVCPTWQHISIELSETELAQPEVAFLSTFPTGEIKAVSDPGAEVTTKLQRIELAVGAARLSLRYSFAEVAISSIPSLARIPHATISVECASDALSQNVDQTLNQLTNDLDDMLSILSLLSRRYVRWLRVVATSRWNRQADDSTTTPNVGFHEAERMRVFWGTRPPHQREPLVRPRALPPDAIQKMVAAYRQSPVKSAIGSAILHAISARDDSFVEGRLTSSFTALESIIHGLSEARGMSLTLDKAQFRALASRVRKLVKDFAVERELNNGTVDAIVRKVPELQRAPIVPRLQTILTDENVAWSDLWPHGTDLSAALAALYSRRSLFIHSGYLESIPQASIDASRVLILTERLLYRLLGGEESWQNPRIDEEVDYVLANERWMIEAQAKST